MMTKKERAQNLIDRLGIRTRAQTLSGMLASIRRRAADVLAARQWPPVPVSRGSAAGMRRISVSALLAECESGQWQARARARTRDDHAPILAALGALVGGCVTDRVDAVPNAYRYPAYSSYASARRYGRVVVLSYGRVQCPRRPYGHGGATCEATPGPCSVYVEARDLARLLPRLPRGWRWGADRLGLRVERDGWSYHPSWAELRGDLIAAASAAYDRQRERIRAGRRMRLLARLSSAVATMADAVDAGYCEPGIRAWCADRGIDPAGSVPISTLIRDRDARAQRVALLVAARMIHRASHAA